MLMHFSLPVHRILTFLPKSTEFFNPSDETLELAKNKSPDQFLQVLRTATSIHLFILDLRSCVRRDSVFFPGFA